MCKTGKQRLDYVDIGAGVMIVWLLYYHALWPMLGYDILRVIPWFFFFMPWFFYKSGYFFVVKPIMESIRKDAGKLLKQFAIWSAVGYVCYLLYHWLLYDDLSLRMVFYSPVRSLILSGSIPLNAALWFLLVLFVIRQVADVLISKFNALCIGIVSGIVAMVIHFVDLKYMPFPVYAAAWGLCFFCIGYYLKKFENNKWLLIISAFLLCLTFICTDIPSVYKCEDTIEWYWYILWYPASIAGCVVFNYMCRLIDMLAKNHMTSINPPLFLKWVGRNAMTIYAVHAIVCRVTQDVTAKYLPEYYEAWQGLLIVSIAYVIIIVPLCLIIEKHRE